MKFTEEQIEKYNNDFHIECSLEVLKKEWFVDRTFGFQDVSGSIFTIRMLNLKTKDNDWVRIPFYDLTQEQIESLLIDKEPIDENKLDELANSIEIINKLPIPYDDCTKECIECFKIGYRSAFNNKEKE